MLSISKMRRERCNQQQGQMFLGFIIVAWTASRHTVGVISMIHDERVHCDACRRRVEENNIVTCTWMMATKVEGKKKKDKEFSDRMIVIELMFGIQSSKFHKPPNWKKNDSAYGVFCFSFPDPWEIGIWSKSMCMGSENLYSIRILVSSDPIIQFKNQLQPCIG